MTFCRPVQFETATSNSWRGLCCVGATAPPPAPPPAVCSECHEEPGAYQYGDRHLGRRCVSRFLDPLEQRP